VKTGEYRHSVNANVAKLLIDELNRNSHAVVFDTTHFKSRVFQQVQTLQLTATWNTLGPTQLEVTKISPFEFKDLETALRALCQDKNCNFDELPPEWLENEVAKDDEVNFVVLNDHVMRRKHFANSNGTVHEGWSVKPAKVVCIKQFAKPNEYRKIEQEIKTLNYVAQNDECSKFNVISYMGKDFDRHGSTVLIFELVQASNFESQLPSLTTDQVAKYMQKLLQALSYLHNRNVIHRDVKPANYLHNFESDIFRLIDFGSAIIGAECFGKKGGGTRGFKAPETLMNIDLVTTAVDIWSTGIILLSLLTGKTHILTKQNRTNGTDCDAINLNEIGMIVGKKEMQKLNIFSCDKYGKGCQFENKTGWAAKALQMVIAERNWKHDDVALDQ